MFQEDRRIFGALTVTFLATRLNTIAQDKTTALLQAAARRIESLALASRIKNRPPRRRRRYSWTAGSSGAGYCCCCCC
ncbi:hypothetical protein WJ972_32150 [Achromobacter insuavis]